MDFITWLTTNKESLDTRVSKVNRAVYLRFADDEQKTSAAVSADTAWVIEVFDAFVIIQKDGKYFRIAYSIDEAGNVVLDAAMVEVQKAWVEVGNGG